MMIPPMLWGMAALAQVSPTGGSPYEVDVARDLAIAGLVGLVSGLPRTQVNEQPGPWCGLQCDPAGVARFDRIALGQRSAAAGTVSDVTYISSMVLPHALGALNVVASRPHDGWAGYGTDTVVLAQTLAISLGFSNGVNYLIRRPRPYAYDPNVSDERRLESIAALSFFSGHTTAAFSMATACSRLFMLRHPSSPMIVPVWAISYSLASTTGVLRVFAGDHFPSDVAVGAAAGIGWGLLIPWTHQIQRGRSRTEARRAALEPLYVAGGAGAVLRVY